MRRVLRIAPAYLLLIALVYALGAVEERGALKWYLTYLSNFLYAIRDAWNPWVMGHSWSLAIEEQFYAFWPLLVFLTPARHRKAACWALIGLSLAYRGFLPLTLEPSITRDIVPPAATDALGAGALLAVWRTRGEALAKGRLGLAAWLGLAGYCAASFVPASADMAGWAGWAAREILLLPDVPALAANGWPRFLVCAPLSVLAASASWFLLEAPVNRLKRHFPYTRRTVPAELSAQA